MFHAHCIGTPFGAIPFSADAFCDLGTGDADRFDAECGLYGDGAANRDGNTGCIAPGRDADLILLDFTHPGLTPCHDPEENLVYSAHGSDVVMNMARGKVIYENGSFLTLDLEDIRARLKDYALPRIFG